MEENQRTLPAYVSELIERGAPKNKTSKAEIKYVKPSFEINCLTTKMNDEDLAIHVMKMKNSLFIWIGKSQNPEFFDLAIGILDRSQNVTSSKIVGPSLNTTSISLAERLTKKLGKLVYVSCNIHLDLMNMPFIEKCIGNAIKTNPEMF